MFVMVDTVREMIVKKAGKYGEYESFDHLLFLFRFVFFGEGVGCCCSFCCCCCCFLLLLLLFFVVVFCV